ncbi:hypothetical protein [Companilactobacillus sp. DQM5]|uniref:hypothetical protein n=1 Tax=Companilactobacillus sp. DQM5 TaxID=3463359 RepID=UPI004059FAA7
MLVINYEGKTKTYDTADQFLGRQILEVPDFEDYTEISSVTLDDKPIELEDKTMLGLYNYLHDQKNNK